MAQSGSSAEVFVMRSNTYQIASNLNKSNNYDCARVDCIASGYATYSKARTKVKKGGEIRIMGLGFTKEVVRPVAAMSLVHSDNVSGDPSSLSDPRLKQNQSIVPSTTMAAVFEAMELKVYKLETVGSDIDGQPLRLERRVVLWRMMSKPRLPVRIGRISLAANH